MLVYARQETYLFVTRSFPIRDSPDLVVTEGSVDAFTFVCEEERFSTSNVEFDLEMINKHIDTFR